MTTTSVTRYSRATTLLHWLGALLIIGLLISGQIMEGMVGPERLELLDIHRKIGLLTGLVFLVRLVLFVRHPRPAADPSWPGWQALAAKVLHGLLYLLPLAMVASGMATLMVFGLAAFIDNGDIAGYMAAREVPPLLVHAIGAKLIMAGIVVHVIAALHHHFIQKDGIFERVSLFK